MNKVSGSFNIKNIHSNRKIILISKMKKCTYIEKEKYATNHYKKFFAKILIFCMSMLLCPL